MSGRTHGTTFRQPNRSNSFQNNGHPKNVSSEELFHTEQGSDLPAVSPAFPNADEALYKFRIHTYFESGFVVKVKYSQKPN
ncbi:hypothetical protein JTB14_026691 [Gonioctena quinquepunctata]|nr:hypothetical protein JTB14_026691 [Gonioctena quinquepunctata]